MIFSAANLASDSDAQSFGVTKLRTVSPRTSLSVRALGINGRAPVPRFTLVGDYRYSEMWAIVGKRL
jgi:hypothetical protein